MSHNAARYRGVKEATIAAGCGSHATLAVDLPGQGKAKVPVLPDSVTILPSY